MEKKKKNAMALTFLMGVIGVGLLIAAFATDHWVRSMPVQNITSGESNTNTTVQGSPSKYTGNITFGLFRGYRVLDYGTGPRDAAIYVKQDLINYGLFDFGLWVTTIVMLALAIVWGLVSIGFATFNVVGKPIETITGPMGLYLWNGLAFTFSLLGVLVFVGLFVKDLSKNILPPDDVDVGWMSQDRTWLDYSFYLVVGATAAFFLNNVVLVMSGQEITCSYSRAAEKELDNGGMILY